MGDPITLATQVGAEAADWQTPEKLAGYASAGARSALMLAEEEAQAHCNWVNTSRLEADPDAIRPLRHRHRAPIVSTSQVPARYSNHAPHCKSARLQRVLRSLKYVTSCIISPSDYY